MKFARVSEHAVERFLERAEPGAPRGEVRRKLGQLAAAGRVRAVPRRWMRSAGCEPGVRYIYAASDPDVCLVARADAVVTVYTRAMFAGQPRRTPKPPRGKPRIDDPCAPLRWPDIEEHEDVE